MVVCVTVIKLTILWQISTVKGLWIKYGWSENKFVWQSRRSKNGGIKYWEWMTRKWGVEGKVRLHLLLSPRVLEQSLKLVQRTHEKEGGEDARRGSKSTHNTRYHTRWLCSRNMTRFWMTPECWFQHSNKESRTWNILNVLNMHVYVWSVCVDVCVVFQKCVYSHIYTKMKKPFTIFQKIFDDDFFPPWPRFFLFRILFSFCVCLFAAE